jgi:hypothetical protein
MKRLKYIFYLFFFLALMNCETDRIIFKGPYFVRFTESSRTEKESFSKIIEIEVHQSQPVLTEDIEITYSIGGDAREGVDYIILGERGKVSIAQGDFFGTIQIQLINNANNIIRSQDLLLTLSSVNTSELQIGQDESGMGKTFTLTIVDDCILGGTYIGKRGSSNQSNITITSADCENYTLSNWNINVFSSSTEMDLKFIDNGDNTLTIPQQEEENISTELATIRGIGVVDPITREISMTITLVDFDGQPEVSLTLIPD